MFKRKAVPISSTSNVSSAGKKWNMSIGKFFVPWLINCNKEMLFYVSAQQEDKFSFSLEPCCCSFIRAGSKWRHVSTNISNIYLLSESFKINFQWVRRDWLRLESQSLVQRIVSWLLRYWLPISSFLNSQNISSFNAHILAMMEVVDSWKLIN